MVERLHRVTVVERAALLADEISLNELTITKLGRELGIAPPGVYRHVADLTDLRAAISAYAAASATAAISAACSGRSGAKALHTLAATLRNWALAHPGQYEALQIPPRQTDEAGNRAALDLLNSIGATLHAYRLEGNDLTDAIRLVRATLHGFISLELNDGFQQPRRIETTFDRAINALDTALTHWSA